MKSITEIVNKVYHSGQITEQMYTSVFIVIPKVSRTPDCNKHWTIGIMSQIPKTVLKVILQQIRERIILEISEEQCGFVEGKGMNNAVFMLQIMAERVIEKQSPVWLFY